MVYFFWSQEGTESSYRLPLLLLLLLLLAAAAAADGRWLVAKFIMYMGKDKFENEELIKYGCPEDVWFARCSLLVLLLLLLLLLLLTLPLTARVRFHVNDLS